MLRVELAVMAFVAVVPSFVIALEGIADPAEIDLEIPVLELVAGLLAGLGPAAVAAYLLWRDGRLDDAGFGRRSPGYILGYGALGAVCCVIALFTVFLVIGLLLTIGGGEVNEVADEEAIDATARTVLAAIAVALIAGFGEEIVFRAYAITRMEEAGFGRAALWAPWALFTVVHLSQGTWALLVIGVVSAVFIWLYRWQRSIWPVMVAHALYDGFIFLLLFAGV